MASKAPGKRFKRMADLSVPVKVGDIEEGAYGPTIITKVEPFNGRWFTHAEPIPGPPSERQADRIEWEARYKERRRQEDAEVAELSPLGQKIYYIVYGGTGEGVDHEQVISTTKEILELCAE